MSDKCEQKEKEQKESIDTKDVHSANCWESANLGDEDRNKKFLRLMGASKKTHQGRFVIGEKDAGHGKNASQTQHMTEELEEQYNQSMEHKLKGGFKSHLGLGFHDDNVASTEPPKEPSFVKSDESETKEPKEGEKTNDKEYVGTKHKLEEDKASSKNEEDAPNVKMMKFVKSSS